MTMPRITPFLFVLAMLFLPLSSHAQWLDGVGVKGGLTAASADDNMNHFDFDRRSGWEASAFAEKRILPFLSVRGEIGYTQRGFVESTSEIDPDGNKVARRDATTRLDYLTMPLLAKFKYNTTPLSIYALYGHRLDILVGRNSGAFEFSEGTVESEIAGLYESTVFGGAIGIGMETNQLPTRLFIESRYDIDFTDSFGSDTSRSVRNNAFSVVMGIAF